jgi:hypothetical protein
MWREIAITDWRMKYLKTPEATAMPKRISA